MILLLKNRQTGDGITLKTNVIQGSFTVTFVVSDDSEFIQGASVTISGNVLTTDVNGEASITLNNGVYSYEISNNGYASHLGSVSGDGSDITEAVTLELLKYNIDLFTIFENSELEGVTVNINGSDHVSDDLGNVSLQLENGTYPYTANKEEYQETTGTLVVDGADDVVFIVMKLSQLFGEDYRYEFNGTELVTKYGDRNIPIVSYGSGSAGDTELAADAVLDLSAFGIGDGAPYDKRNYVGNSFGFEENWDYPFLDLYDDSNPANGTTCHWTVNELNYRLLEAQWVAGDLKQLYAKLIFENETLQGLTELFIYDSAVVDETDIFNYVRINDFQDQGNFYYTNEWIIRDMLQFVVEGDSFSLELNGTGQTVYWGDGTSDVVDADATYSHNFDNDDKHLIGVTDGLTVFDISGLDLEGDIAYWQNYLSSWTNIVDFLIY